MFLTLETIHLETSLLNISAYANTESIQLQKAQNEQKKQRQLENWKNVSVMLNKKEKKEATQENKKILKIIVTYFGTWW